MTSGGDTFEEWAARQDAYTRAREAEIAALRDRVEKAETELAELKGALEFLRLHTTLKAASDPKLLVDPVQYALDRGWTGEKAGKRNG